jgi:hypothetical protein
MRSVGKRKQQSRARHQRLRSSTTALDESSLDEDRSPSELWGDATTAKASKLKSSLTTWVKRFCEPGLSIDAVHL